MRRHMSERALVRSIQLSPNVGRAPRTRGLSAAAAASQPVHSSLPFKSAPLSLSPLSKATEISSSSSSPYHQSTTSSEHHHIDASFLRDRMCSKKHSNRPPPPLPPPPPKSCLPEKFEKGRPPPSSLRSFSLPSALSHVFRRELPLFRQSAPSARTKEGRGQAPSAAAGYLARNARRERKKKKEEEEA